MVRLGTRDRLLAAGLTALHARGFNACGVQDIAEAAGVPKGSFYNHFASKEAFGCAVLDSYWRQAAAGDLMVLSDETRKPRKRLKLYFDRMAAALAATTYQNGCLVGNFSAELADQSRLMRDRLAALMAGWSKAVELCIGEAQRAGEVSDDFAASTLAGFLLDAWQGAVLRTKIDRDAAALDRFRAVVFDKILS